VAGRKLLHTESILKGLMELTFAVTVIKLDEMPTPLHVHLVKDGRQQDVPRSNALRLFFAISIANFTWSLKIPQKSGKTSDFTPDSY
jgi:hypothetical protein